MIGFSEIRTKRFSFKLKELTVRQSRDLCNKNNVFIEKMRSDFLGYVVENLKWNDEYKALNLDLEDLTISERLLIESQYLLATSADGDFLIGDYKYSDYLFFDKQYNHDFTVFTINNLEYIQKQITGKMILEVEEFIYSNIDKPTRFDWWLALIGISVSLKNDEKEKELKEKVKELESLTEVEFLKIFDCFLQALDKLEHLFKLSVDDKGVVVLPKIDDEGVELYPARFCSITAVNRLISRI